MTVASTLTPINTWFNGNWFRSRLEARYAVLFTSLRIRFEYEMEAYRLGNLGGYLPDFWLPDVGCWVEIKPGRPNQRDAAVVHELARRSGRWVWLFMGTPQYNNLYEQRGARYRIHSVGYYVKQDQLSTWVLGPFSCRCPVRVFSCSHAQWRSACLQARSYRFGH